MKRRILLLILACLAGSSSWAYDFSAVAPTGQTLYYNITGSNKVEVTSQNGSYPYYSTKPTGDLTIPDTVSHSGTVYSVTSIGNNAFRDCSGLTSVTIGDGVTSIGNYAFYKCSGLTSVTIPDGVTSIGNSTFSNCSGLTSITIPDGVTSIGNYAFSSCSGLTSVIIPDGVTSIGNSAFSNCSGLTSVVFNIDSCADFSYGFCPFFGCSKITSFTFGDNVRRIPGHICYGLTGLTSITIPEGVTTIGNSAFEGCSGLTSITIPDGVISIGSSAFYSCSGLTSVVFNADSCADISSENSPFSNCSNLTSFTFGDNVRRIPGYICYGLTGLTSVTIPDGVTTIGNSAFSGCSGLTSITIPDGVTSIGNSAFSGCSGLTSITIPDGVTSIGNHAFRECSGLTSITIPEGVTSIGNAAFYGCSGLTSVTIGNGVTSIGVGAFSYCSGLTKTNYTGTVAQWCEINFEGEELYYSSNPVSYSHNFFINDVEIKDLVIPDTVTSIGNFAFSGCSGLTSVTIGDGVTSIGGCAFSGCSGLTSVTIGDGVTSIGGEAFKGCSGLTSVTIPGGVTSIDDEAFRGCSGLLKFVCKSIYPPKAYSSTFYSVPTYCTLTVPCGSLSYYSVTEPWKTQFQLMEEDCRPEYTVTVVSADPTMGTVSGGGKVLEGDMTTIKAKPNSGYRFAHWNDNDTHAVRTITVTSDMSFTAYFEIDNNEGIEDAAEEQTFSVYAADGSICINTQKPIEVAVYDMTGRRLAARRDDFAMLRFDVPASGAYLVKVGHAPARRVVVIK